MTYRATTIKEMSELIKGRHVESVEKFDNIGGLNDGIRLVCNDGLEFLSVDNSIDGHHVYVSEYIKV